MRLEGERESANVEDERGSGSPVGMRMPGGVGGGLGIGGIAVVVVLALVFGIDPREILQGPSDSAPRTGPAIQRPAGDAGNAPGDDGLKRFVSQVLASTEDTWTQTFQQIGRTYQDPKLVLFSGAVESACGYAQAAVGPFYCPRDEKVYLDLDFFHELSDRFHAPGDFAQAYVVAHEVGHHVQNLLGISDKVRARQQEGTRSEANALSVRLELQADCFAGVWANRANRDRHILETGDIEEGLRAATAIGDDRLQKQARGYVVPDSFTHGTSQQRVSWFRRGIESGDMKQCDTFNAARP